MKFDAASVKKIAIFRALQLGDMLCVIPAIRSLRTAFPNAEIILLGLPWAAEFTNRFAKYFDRFIHFPGYAGLPEQEVDICAFNTFIDSVQEEHFDLLLQMQGNGTVVNSLMLLFKARFVAGFHNRDSHMASDLFMQYPAEGSEVRRHLQLMTHLGIKSCGDQLEFPLNEQDYREFRTLAAALEEEQYVCIHPGSRGAWRQWAPCNFAAVADVCASSGYKVVITGTRDEKSITEQVIHRMAYPSVDLTGKTTLGSVGALIKNASLLVANCTGVSHIAAATHTPSVVISMDGEPERWGPIDSSLHATIDCSKNERLPDVLQAIWRKLLPASHTHELMH
jgi:ADP-heptose:LPS heptosyltransferase